jgi:hypothetical protein
MCEFLDLTDPFRTTFPNRKEFTYVPRNALQNNRSRIDFFLVSRSILTNNYECSIKPSLLHSSFDHKPILLEFFPPKRNNLTPKIFNSTIDNPETEICVWSTVFEMHLIHADTERIRGGVQMQRELLCLIGRAKKLFRDAGPHPDLLLAGQVTDIELQDRANLLREIEQIKNIFIRIEIFDISLNVSADIFMETLIIAVRNEVLSYQTFIKKMSESVN